MTPVMIHPTADVSSDVQIGSGTRVWHQAQIREGARIGRECNIGKGVYIGEGVSIGDAVKIQNYASLFAGATVESKVFIGPGVIFTNDKRPRAVTSDGRPSRDGDWAVGRIVVRQGASIGAGCIIVTGVEIGEWAMVGAGSVVTRDIGSHTLALGAPARAIGSVCICGAQLRLDAGRQHCPECLREYLTTPDGVTQPAPRL